MATWRIVRDYLVKFFKGHAIKLALKKLLGSAVAGGFKAWVVKFIATELFEEIAQPIIELSVRKGFLVYDKVKGKIIVKKINKAKDEENKSDYMSNIGRV